MTKKRREKRRKGKNEALKTHCNSNNETCSTIKKILMK